MGDDGNGDAADHEDDFVGMAGYILVHPALEVGELTLEGIVAGAAHAYLVGDEDESGVLRGEAVELRLEDREGFIYVVEGEEEVGTPEGDAVDDCHSTCEVVLTEVFLLLDVVPFWASTLLVLEDTLTKLVVPDMGGCHIDGMRGEGEGKTLGMLALAGALTTGDEDDSFHGLNGEDGVNGDGEEDGK